MGVLGAAVVAGAACSSPEPAAPEPSKASPQAHKAEAAAIHECNICGYKGKFDRIGARPDASCKRCKSRERHRLLMHYLEHETPLLRDKLDVLHFSPMRGETQRLRKLKNLRYVTAEYEANKADLQLDLTALTQPDASWDVLIVYHILEHIPDDRKAMAEMFRVLRPGGMAILQVPLKTGNLQQKEDPTVVDPKERAKEFGQWDHVRMYAAPVLKERLEATGFVVEAVDYLGKLDPATVEKFSLHSRTPEKYDEHIWIARKPANAAAAPAAGAPPPAEPAKAEPVTTKPAKAKKK